MSISTTAAATTDCASVVANGWAIEASPAMMR